MKRYKITIGCNNSFRIVIPDRQTNAGNIVITGLISPIYLTGDTNLLLETVYSILKSMITPSVNDMSTGILMSAIDAIQSICPSINSEDIGINLDAKELIEIHYSFKESALTINTDIANMRVVKLSYVSDWSPFDMGDLSDMTIDEMCFTEVV